MRRLAIELRYEIPRRDTYTYAYSGDREADRASREYALHQDVAELLSQNFGALAAKHGARYQGSSFYWPEDVPEVEL